MTDLEEGRFVIPRIFFLTRLFLLVELERINRLHTMATQLPFTKRTKQEIVDEYEKMQSELEHLRQSAKTVYSQPAMDLVKTTKEQTPQAIEKVFADAELAVRDHLSAVRDAIAEQSKTFQEIQDAIELSRQQLELQRNIVLATDTLDVLIEDHAKKMGMFETEAFEKSRMLEEQIIAKKKAWERDAEEYEYQKKLTRERDRVEAEVREKGLSDREDVLRTQEVDVVQMRKAIEHFPQELETKLVECEQRTADRVTTQFAHEKALVEKETSSQIRLLELTVKNVEEKLTNIVTENIALKKIADEANAKAQALAMKAIERPTTIVTPTQNTQNAQ